MYCKKRVYYRVTILFTKTLLAEATYPYYDWLISIDEEKGLYFSCN